MGVYVKGTPKEGEYKLIKTTDGFVLDGKDIAYACTEIDLVRCKDCKHFHYDKPYVIQGIPILGHEVCDFWGDGCKTNPNGFCSYGERSE